MVLYVLELLRPENKGICEMRDGTAVSRVLRMNSSAVQLFKVSIPAPQSHYGTFNTYKDGSVQGCATKASQGFNPRAMKGRNNQTLTHCRLRLVELQCEQRTSKKEVTSELGRMRPMSHYRHYLRIDRLERRLETSYFGRAGPELSGS